MLPVSELKSWHREVDGVKYLCTTDPRHIQLGALNAALSSDMLWWARALPETHLKRIVEHSLCFGLYVEKPSPRTGSADGTPLQAVIH